MVWVRERLGVERVSERRACQVLGQVRSTQRRERQIPDDEARLVAEMVELATQYGRYGYRRVTAMLQGEGWKVNLRRVALRICLTTSVVIAFSFRLCHNQHRQALVGCQDPPSEGVGSHPLRPFNSLLTLSPRVSHFR